MTSPPEAVDAIAHLLHEAGCGDEYRCADLAERAVEHAAPALRAQGAATERARIRQFAIDEAAKYPVDSPWGSPVSAALVEFADLLDDK